MGSAAPGAAVEPKNVPIPPDLQAIVDQWGDLPDAVKAGIVAMVEATRPACDVRELGSGDAEGEALFEILMLGGHVESAAGGAGMSVRTAYRRLADPVFRQQVEAGREAIRDSIVTKLAEAASDAIDCLRERMDSEEEPDLRLKSAKALLDGIVKIQNAAPRSSAKVRYTVEQTRNDC